MSSDGSTVYGVPEGYEDNGMVYVVDVESRKVVRKLKLPGEQKFACCLCLSAEEDSLLLGYPPTTEGGRGCTMSVDGSSSQTWGIPMEQPYAVPTDLSSDATATVYGTRPQPQPLAQAQSSDVRKPSGRTVTVCASRDGKRFFTSHHASMDGLDPVLAVWDVSTWRHDERPGRR